MSLETRNAGVAFLLSIFLVTGIALVSVWVREYLKSADTQTFALYQ